MNLEEDLLATMFTVFGAKCAKRDLRIKRFLNKAAHSTYLTST